MPKYYLKNKDIELTEEEVNEIIRQKEEPKGTQIKRWDNDEVIYTFSKQTMKEAVEEAVKNGVNLEYANLRYANLRDADLWNAKLWNAKLWNADLQNANLRDANLREANLRDANLLGADLQNARFYGRGGTQKLTQEQVPVFLKALGFEIEE